MKLVQIDWWDHSSRSNHNWDSLEAIAKDNLPLLCQSVGWLVHDGKDTKVIVSNVYAPLEGLELKGCHDMTILVPAIKKITVLRK